MEKSQCLRQKQAQKKKTVKAKRQAESLYPPSIVIPKYVIGIDPGLRGAVAVLSQDFSKKKIMVHEVFDCPLKAGGLTKKARENPNSITFDLQGMLHVLRTIGKRYEVWDTQVFIEQSQVMSKGGRQQGSVSNFTIGYGYGLWMMALVSVDLPWIYSFAPIEWSRRLFSMEPYKSMETTKDRSIAYVKAVFPKVSLLPEDNKRVKKERDGRADAIAIACYGIQHYMWEDK